MADVSTKGWPIIDTDTHIAEPADLWTARVPSKWKDQVPYVQEHSGPSGRPRLGWFLGGKYIGIAPSGVMVSWKYPPPAAPPTFEDAIPAAYDIHARVKLMDEMGIWGQVLYPNVGSGRRLMQMEDEELSYECVKIYNDWVAEWTSPYKERFRAPAAMPLWDVDRTIKEMHRVKDLGYTSLLWLAGPHQLGLPPISDEHWDRVYAAAQELDMPLNLHGGSGRIAAGGPMMFPRAGRQGNFCLSSMSLLIGAAQSIVEWCYTGTFERFPDLKVGQIESGIGYIPSILEGMDWQWIENFVWKERPGDHLPSELFHRNMMCCFWFEKVGPSKLVEEIGEDNILFETDFPHPTSVFPESRVRQQYTECFGDQPERVRRKILFENAARFYKMDLPKDWQAPEPKGDSFHLTPMYTREESIEMYGEQGAAKEKLAEDYFQRWNQ